ncbi:MAG: DNRLRE domain-containing protein [Dehalococcoidia bacterium]
MPELTVQPAKDSYLSAVAKDTNYGAGQFALVRVVYAGDLKLAWERAIGNFDVSVLAGATIESAKLVRHVWSLPGGGGHDAIISRCTRPADWVENQVTWNKYRTGANWTAAGGDFDDAVPGAITYSEPTSTGDHEVPGLKPHVEDALANRSGIVSLLIRLADEDPDVDQGAGWRTKEYGADVWRLTIDYTLPPDAGRRSLSGSRHHRAPAVRPGSPVRPAAGTRPATAQRPSVRRPR